MTAFLAGSFRVFPEVSTKAGTIQVSLSKQLTYVAKRALVLAPID